MKTTPLLASLLLQAAFCHAGPWALDPRRNVTYEGLERNGVEVFLGIPYALDTGGPHRFRPPRPRLPPVGSSVPARSYGPACPQQLGSSNPPISLSDVTRVAEDCLNLNVARPRGACAGDALPVMVYIHGGGFWNGQNSEITIRPDGLVLESVRNRLPVIHVAMNYRLGVFGFAQSDTLRAEGSENAGLRDQRLAIEWVRDNIKYFGGDPDKITIFGQSSGGLAVGMQIMAYGGSKPVPFQQAICESQALEPGITGNFTRDAMQLLLDHVGCNSSGSSSSSSSSSGLENGSAIACLRALDWHALLNASLATYRGDIAHNIGDIWLPAVDGDFVPAAPSRLVRERRFANVTAMVGWCEDDVTLFTDAAIATAADTRAFVASYLPGVTPAHLDALLALYPAADFALADDRPSNLSAAEFFRASRVLRDVLMTCQPMWYAEHMARAGGANNDVFLYDWNQTILDPILARLHGRPGLGAVHTSEFAYVFGNLSHYNTSGYPFDPTPADYALRDRGSRSWSTFASIGRPGLEGRDTFRGFEPAFSRDGQTYVFVVGGPHEGLSAIDGPDAKPEVKAQKLRERCAFINSPEMIEQLGY